MGHDQKRKHSSIIGAYSVFEGQTLITCSNFRGCSSTWIGTCYLKMAFLTTSTEKEILVCYLGSQKQRSCCDEVSVKLGETVEHVESLHVYYRCVDT